MGGHTFASITAGEWYTCGVSTGSEAYCWGKNEHGQLGNGTTLRQLAPVAVLGGLTFNGLSANEEHTCGVDLTGDGYCWGLNNRGQLGNGAITTDATMTPVLVAGGLRFTSISAGEIWHTCGLTTVGMAYCWGQGGAGQLGDGSEESDIPVPVSGGMLFTLISAGGYHSCGVTAEGSAFCWGHNHEGELGNGTTTSVAAPVPVAGGHRFASLSAGVFHTCGVTTDGEGYCWGWNGSGVLGNGSISASATPVPTLVTGGLRFASIDAGFIRTCGVTTLGALYCWGFPFGAAAVRIVVPQ